MIKVQTLKGFRDFLPKDAKKREYVTNTLKAVFESYGFEPLETPSLEYQEILAGKYGEEGDKLMYKFEDNGKRKVALRYDQTVPLARVVAKYQNDLPMPFKRYQIQNVWRAENTQKGRYREFLQCDIDIVGSPSFLADAEIIACALECIKKLGFKNAKVLINDRSVFSTLDKFQSLQENELQTVIRAIDKLTKVGEEKVLDELIENGIGIERATYLLQTIKKQKPTKNVLDVFSALEKMGISNENVEFLPTLARGLDYYTGMIFEVEVEGYDVGSVAGGGRYDNLIDNFSGKQIPAVGIAFGFDRLIEAMDELNLFPAGLSVTKVLVTNTNKWAFKISQTLRESGINTETFLEEKDLEKQLKYADKKGIPYTLIFEDDKFILKDMIRRTQETLTLEEIIKKLNKS